MRAEWWSKRGIERNPDEFYVYYHAIARVLQPRVIAEIGVWWGYALMAMATGTLFPHQHNTVCDIYPDCSVHGRSLFHVYGFDNESYPGAEHCLDWAAKCFNEINVPNTMLHCNSRQFDTAGLPTMLPVDLFSVDGEHSYQDAYKDLVLADKVMNKNNPDCALLVDDVGWALSVRDSCEDFAKEFGWQTHYLPTLKGTCVITLK